MNDSDKVKSIFDLPHRVIVRNNKRIMTCVKHFCDIDSMSEGEYYKQKQLQTKEKENKS